MFSLQKIRSTVGWLLRGMPLNSEEKDSLYTFAQRRPGPSTVFVTSVAQRYCKPAKRVSPRKVTAGQLLLPEYADTREGVLLRELMEGDRRTIKSLTRSLRMQGHDVFEGHKELSNVRACLRRSCLTLPQENIRVGSRYIAVVWLTYPQIKALRDEAARLAA